MDGQREMEGKRGVVGPAPRPLSPSLNAPFHLASSARALRVVVACREKRASEYGDPQFGGGHRARAWRARQTGRGRRSARHRAQKATQPTQVGTGVFDVRSPGAPVTAMRGRHRCLRGPSMPPARSRAGATAGEFGAFVFKEKGVATRGACATSTSITLFFFLASFLSRVGGY